MRSALLTTHLALSGVHVALGGRPVLVGVDLTAAAGDRVALVGENGRGKTTLLRVLAGDLVPDSGEVRRAGSTGVADQELPAAGTVGDLIDRELTEVRAALAALDAATLTVAEDAEAYDEALARVEALDAWAADRRVDVSLAALGAVTDRARPLRTLSVGRRHRVRLAGLLGARHPVLLLDEPTNHLDAGGLAHLTERLRSHPGVVVLASHDRALLADVATTVVDLDPTSDGRPRTYGGGWAGYREGRAAERARWETAYRDQGEEHRRLADDLSAAQNRLQSGWRPPKGTGRHTRATKAPALVRAVHRRQEELAAHRLSVPPPPLRFAVPALTGTALHAVVDVPGRLGRTVVDLGAGGRLVVTGPNGAGKSTLLDGLAAAAGRVGYLRQESDLPADRSAHQVHEALTARLVSSGQLAEDEVVPLGAVGLLSGGDASRPLGELSVGARRRVDLALVLAARPRLLLLDEPTNHLSATLVDELTAALRHTPATVVVATHDRQLLRDTRDWPALPL
ncbi:ATP-binding cassette domain-containing protein [Pseudonocardia pini]|uniref:ATP-binding cassette domain-containing protein n=1 Tax=Pseudonocardia pini TaxID=2758030 RepID=UPI0015F04AAB|nr:ATP-binding cassette domain-containing protein [Pseudonocardia pini]